MTVIPGQGRCRNKTSSAWWGCVSHSVLAGGVAAVCTAAADNDGGGGGGDADVY